MQDLVKYTRTAIIIHWIVALIIFFMLYIGFTMTDIPRGTPERAFYYNLHKSFGVTIFFLIIFRIFWRWKNPPPKLPENTPKYVIYASKINHTLLYMSMIMMPLAGFIATQFTKYGVTYFWLFKIPSMGFENKDIYNFFQAIHTFFAWTLTTLIFVHLMAVIKHVFINKDKIFHRIIP